MAERHLPERLRYSASTRSSDPNVFSDDYALEEYQSHSGRNETPIRRDVSSASSALPRRASSHQQGFASQTNPTRRSRLSQRSHARTSVSSRTDDQSSLASRPSNPDLARTDSLGYPSSRRTLSTVTAPRAQSPYQGDTGPSHPYGMYPQDITISRTASVATASTIRRLERTYSGPGGPTQPYGMYPQNTVTEDEDSEESGATSIAAGFPGRGQNYRRRLGPDGEDADDLIGPDGYTEQLPAYTRYPNAIPPKYDSGAPQDNEPLPAPQQSPGQPVEQVHYRPAEYYMPPRGQQSPTASDPFDDRSAQSNTAAPTESAVGDEKTGLKDRIKRKGRRKVCCGLLPCWLLLFVVVVLCLAILLGGVIGGIVAQHGDIHKTWPSNTPTSTAPSYVPTAATPQTITLNSVSDAVPISTPTGLPPLPTGSFNLVLDNPYSTSNACLATPSQNNSWDCSTGAKLSIEVSMSPAGGPEITLDYDQTPGTSWRYGAQPPELNGPTNLRVVQDKDEWSKGAAYFFNNFYNKTVIVREQDFPGPNVMKRSILEGRDSDWTQNQFASVSDKPWFCFWNNTMIEGFIYVSQDDDPSDTASNAAPTGSMYGASPTAPPRHKRDDYQAPGTPYPKVVKIEERRPRPRLAGPAYCQQMQILYNWQPGTIGEPVYLDLDGPNYAGGNAAETSDSYGSQRLVRRTLGQRGPNTCMCEWQN